MKCLLAGQLKLPVVGQCLFHPMDGTADGTFGATVINADVFHGAVFAVVLQGDEEFVTDGEVWRFSSCFVLFFVGGLQDSHHFLENRLGGSDVAFELLIWQFQCFCL